MTENQLPAPVARAATLAQELARLVGEYQDDDAGDATKEEAWNMIADFAVENSQAIAAALSHPAALSGGDSVAVLTAYEAKKICERLEFDASWDKCGSGYYSLKRQIAALAGSSHP